MSSSCDLQEQQQDVDLVFVGSPLLDITASCDQEILQLYNLSADGCIKATELHDSLFQQLFKDPETRLDAGGSALNSSKIAKWILGRRGRSAFVGCVGQDEYANKLHDDLQSSGVDPLFVTLPGYPTGICACILTPDGKRSMCTRHGAAASFKKEHLEEQAISSRLKEANCVFVVGYFFAHSPEAVHTLARRCSPSQLFSLSLSAEYICKEFTEDILKVLPRVDILFGNSVEVVAFAKAAAQKDHLTDEQAASFIASLKTYCAEPRIVVVTRGANSVIIAKGTDTPHHYPVLQNVSVVDSVGCGDAVAGAFLGVYIITGNMERAILSGIKMAAQIAEVPGCDLTQIEKLTF